MLNGDTYMLNAKYYCDCELRQTDMLLLLLLARNKMPQRKIERLKIDYEAGFIV